jgi:hypothetical protein
MSHEYPEEREECTDVQFAGEQSNDGGGCNCNVMEAVLEFGS